MEGAEHIECVGGPLDGRCVVLAMETFSCFPWPEGWYYLSHYRDTSERIYRWDPQWFIDADRGKCQEVRFADG